MANDPKHPQVGERSIDATDLALIDLPEGATAGKRREHDGIAEVIAEITGHHEAWGLKAGITQPDFDALTAVHARIEKIDEFIPAAEKLVEMLWETRIECEDERERRIAMISKSVDDRAAMLKDTELLARYQLTRQYRSAIANKAAKTRRARKAAEEKAAEENATETPETPTNPT